MRAAKRWPLHLCAAVWGLTFSLGHFAWATALADRFAPGSVQSVGWGVLCAGTVLLLAAGLAALFDFLLFRLADWLDRLAARPAHKNRTSAGLGGRIAPLTRGQSAALWGVNLLCWLPYYIVYFPGVLTNDSFNQLEQALGLRAYSNHHPWLHTLFIQLCCRLCGNSPQAGAALYTACSVLLMAGVFTLVLAALSKLRLPRWGWLCCWAFYVLLPLNGCYAVSMWKDIFWSGCLLLFSLLLVALGRDRFAPPTRGQLVGFFALSVLLMALRSNGLLVWLLTVVFFLLWRQGGRRTFALVSAAALALILLYKGPILRAFAVTPPDPIESLSIPAQQIARVFAEGAEVPDEDCAVLERIVDTDRLGEVYTSFISDPVKNLVRERNNQADLQAHRGDYLGVYLRLLARHPALYIQAYVDQTSGYWCPGVTYDMVCTVTMEHNRFGLGESWPLYHLGDQIAYYFSHLFNRVWSLGASTWLALLCLALVLRRGGNVLYFLPSLFTLCSLLVATPVYAEFRYAYGVFLCLPLFVCSALERERMPEPTDVHTA